MSLKKSKKPTKKQIAANKKAIKDSYNREIDDYIEMVHSYYKSHIKNPYVDVNASVCFSGFTTSGFYSYTKKKDFVDLVILLNGLKKA